MWRVVEKTRLQSGCPRIADCLYILTEAAPKDKTITIRYSKKHLIFKNSHVKDNLEIFKINSR